MGKRGPPPKPTALKQLTGNPGKRGLNEKEPVFASMNFVEAPDILDAVGKAEWARIYKQLDVNGLITVVDRAALAAYCMAYSRWVLCEDALKKSMKKNTEHNGIAIKGYRGSLVLNPLVRAADSAMELMLKSAAQFGMTPAARSNIQATKQPDENPFQNLGGPARHQIQ